MGEAEKTDVLEKSSALNLHEAGEAFSSLGKLAGVSSAFIGAVILLSISYEVGYFAVIGSRWLTIYEPTDYLALAVESVPRIIAIAAASIVLGLFARKLRRSRAKPEAKKETLVRRIARYSIVVLIFAFLWLVSPETDWTTYGILAGVIWVSLFDYIAPTGHTLLTKTLLFIGSMFPYFVITIFVIGSFDARFELRAPTFWGVVELVDGRELPNTTILRNLRKGLLVYKDNAVRIIKWDDVKSIKVVTLPASVKPRSCVYLGYGCGNSG